MSSPSYPSQPPEDDANQFAPQTGFWFDHVVHVGLAGIAGIPILVAIALFAVFIYESWLFFQDVSLWSFLTDSQWTPSFSIEQYGIFVLASGTFLISAIAIIVAVPLGLLIAIYLSEYASTAEHRILKPLVEALAGVPTIVYGYFALQVVTPNLLKPIFSGIGTFNALSAGLVTGVLITPIISAISEDAIANVPHPLKEGGYALGFTKLEVIYRIVIPNAFAGIVAAVTLAASRALGETMIASIAAGQSPKISLNPMSAVESITAFIIQVSLGDVPPSSFMFHTIFTVGFVLFLATLSLNWLGHWLVDRHHRKMQGLIIPQSAVHPDERQENGQLGRAIDALSLQSSARPSSRPRGNATDATEFVTPSTGRELLDAITVWVLRLATGICVAIFLLLMIVTLQQGASQLDWHFLTSPLSRLPEETGIYTALIGTLEILVLTMIIAWPIGVGAAIYLEEYCSRTVLNRLIEINLANLAAIPSILYGLLGLAVFARSLRSLTGGSSFISAALVLAIIVLPLIIISTRTALRAIPASQRQASYALGMSRYQMLITIVVPSAFPGIVTGTLLAISRAIGEAAALIAVGAVAFASTPVFSWDGLRGGFTSLPTQIYYWVSRPQREFPELTAAAIIVLGAIVLIINIVAVLVRDIYRKPT